MGEKTLNARAPRVRNRSFLLNGSSVNSQVFELLIKAWSSGSWVVRGFILLSGLCFFLGGLNAVLRVGRMEFTIALLFTSAVLVSALRARQRLIDKDQRDEEIEAAEERFRENPDEPQFAWDLARKKLESYLDRNLSQVQSIYWLTLIVMLCGFGFILYGLFEASQNESKLAVSIVASASGVLISFIGGSFLVIYRSILTQSKEYVTVLERINAVGMAVQVIGSIPDRSADIKDRTTAGLAEQLLAMYASMPHRSSVGSRVGGPSAHKESPAK